jgi:phosphomannomutase
MAEAINPSIFRAYDIRGLVDVDLTEETMHILGQAAGTFFRRQSGHTLVVGRDVRPSSPRFQAALSEGLRQVGIDVIDIGEVATPVMYFAVEHLRAGGGIVISASHNPPEYNGVKLRRANPTYGSEPLTSADIQDVSRIAQSGQFASGTGTIQQADVADAYIQSVAHVLRLSGRPRVVLDGGNGVAGPLALRAFEAAGAEVVPLYIEPDGTFPNHHPDPLKAENMRDLIAAVREHGATLGIALDGDGDRLGVVDGTGEMVWADRYLIVLARDMLARRAGAVVFDVKCSTVLIDAIRAAGGTPVMGKTGYPNMSAKMRETNAVLGGELSGHTMLPYPGHYYDDGAFAGIHLLASLERLSQDEPLTLAAALEPYPVLPALPEQRITFSDTAKFAVVEAVREHFAPHYTVIDVDGVRVDFGDGWGVIRTSNTEPAITTRFEAATEARLHVIRDMMLDVVEDVRASQQT